MKKATLTEKKVEQTPSGGALVGKRQGQTIIHNKGTLSGYLVGKTHAEGGIKAVNKSTGQALEMQGGEVVITAPAVSDTTKNEFNGKMMTNREILSTINEKGGGVSFAKGGDVPKNIKRTGASYKYGGKTMTDHEIYKHITGGHLADGMTLSQIAKKHKVSLKELQKQVDLGMKAESEHTSSKREQMKIVKDHLFENPKYYTLLKRAGLEDGAELGKWKKLTEENLIPALSITEEYKSYVYKNAKIYYSKIDREWLLEINNKIIKGYPTLSIAKKRAEMMLLDTFNHGGRVNRQSLVRDSKRGNTPARDLNNYNDVLDIDADGIVGAETGLFDDGGMMANGGLIAPNGKPSNLTTEQYKLVRTPEFKEWFGDWEKLLLTKLYDAGIDEVTLNKLESDVSKVVDENGEPLVVFHGGKINNILKSMSDFDKGIYFTSNKYFAQDIFALKVELQERDKKNEYDDVPEEMLESAEWEDKYFKYSKVYNVFLNIKNPQIVDSIDAKLIPKNYENGFDGFIAKYTDDFGYGADQIIAFEPNQIKLADGTNTTFDSSNPDIRYELGGIFHGSPYNFDKFNTSKMGSGIGQQEDGWGIYLTDNKEATKNYGKYIYETTLFKNKSLAEYNFIDLKKPVNKNIVTKIVKAVYEKYNKDFDIIEFNQYYDYIKDKSLPKVDFNDYELVEFDYAGYLFYKTLSRKLGGDKNASLFLLDNGIDGLKRSFENSKGVYRTDYVIFDENAITIENKEFLSNNYYDDGGRIDKANYRIINPNGRIKYAGTGMPSWFTLDNAKKIVDYSNGEMIYEYDNNGERLFEVFDDGGSVGVETVLFAVRKGEPDYNEVLITNNPDKIEDAKKWALANGFDRLRISKIDMMEKPDFKKTFDYGGKVNKARYRIIDSNGRLKYTGTEMGSWFTLEKAKELVNYSNGEMIYEFDYNGDRLYEVLATGGNITQYDANMEGDSVDMMFADGGAVGSVVKNWNEVPSIWKDTSKVKKVAWTNSPYDKGLYSIVAPFLGKDELRPIFGGINFDDNGITVTNAHVLITLPYPNKKFEGTYEADLSKKANPEQITIDGKYPNYSAIIPKQEVTKPFFIDVYKLLQYNNVAMKFANKYYNAVNYKIEDEIVGFNAKFLNESLKTLLKLGHETAYAHYMTPQKALLLSPNKDYEIGNDEIILTMPVMIQNKSYGAVDIDYKRELSVYYDFNDNEIHNADGSIAEFKMNYANNSVISKEDVNLLEKLANGKNRLQILNNVIVENGVARASDLETEFYLTGVDLPNGIYNSNKGALEITMEAIEDFPRKPIFVADENTIEFSINSDVLEYYVDKLKYVVGKDDLRPVMKGICLHHTSNNKLFLAGTDANILLKVDITEYVEMPVFNKDMKFIIEPKMLYDFLNSVENTSLKIKSNLVATIIETDSWSFYARNIDGNYPNYNAVIPTNTNKLANVSIEPIKKAFNSELVKNYVKESDKNLDIFIFNQQDEVYIANSQRRRSDNPYDVSNIKKICETSVDFRLAEYYIENQSVLLIMPFGYDKQTNFSFRKDIVDRVIKIVNDNKLELHYTEFNRAYVIPIHSFEFKTTTKEHKVKEQKPSIAEVKLVSTINEVNEIKEAIETLEMLLETATRKDKKEIKEAIEVLQMLLDTYEY